MDGLQYNDERHEYRLNGTVIPGVTEVLKSAGIGNLSHIAEETLWRKSALGKAVHEACELLDQGKADAYELHPEVQPYVAGYRLFLREHKPKVLAVEEMVAHPQLQFAGTLDRRYRLRDKRHALFDLKATAAMPASVGPQTAGYELALPEHIIRRDGPVQARYCLRLLPDGTYRMVELTDVSDRNTFLSALNIHRWKQRHGH